jgi:PelA/Pel-15E family pectate lyase
MRKIIHSLLFLGCLSFYSCAIAQTNIKAEIKTDSIADKMLVYQLGNGAWPKQLADKSVVNYNLVLSPKLLDQIKNTSYLNATIDNHATTREINALIKAYKTTANPKYLKAVEKAIDYLLNAQYGNGGWPQYYPDQSLYRAEITFNDDAIVNVITIMQHIVLGTNDFDQINPKYKAKAQKALDRGIDCILKTQVFQNGKLSIWAAQYNQISLQPAKARSFEPSALSTSESVGIVRFLMKIKDPNEAIKNAIIHAVNWFDQAKITGWKFDKLANGDKGLIADQSSVIWARFYDINTNQPIFGDRDNSIKSNVAEISFERRNNYAWYGVWAKNLIAQDFVKWTKLNTK